MSGFRSGYVALAGRPNVGKSTILNAVVGQKVAIVAHRRQTTRTKLLGVRTTARSQMIFIDTPGLHSPSHRLGESMVRSSRSALADADLVVFVTAPGSRSGDDGPILDILATLSVPAVLAVNKIDAAQQKDMDALIAACTERLHFREVLRLSARTGRGVDRLLDAVERLLPEGPKYYDDDMVTDQIERVMAAELVREKVIGHTSEEVPHAVAVEVTRWKERSDGIVEIGADIFVELEGQKGIIIGRQAGMLKKIGTAARRDIEALVGRQVFLELRVKVRKDWRNNPRILKELGYH